MSTHLHNWSCRLGAYIHQHKSIRRTQMCLCRSDCRGWWVHTHHCLLEIINRTTRMNLIYSTKPHSNTRTFLYHLTNTCLLIKSVQNEASGTEALLHSINDCTCTRATTITSTGLIGCSENRVACNDYSTVLCKNKIMSGGVIM